MATTSTVAAPFPSTPNTTHGGTTTVSTSTSTTIRELNTGDVVGFSSVEMRLDGETWMVAVADTPELRGQGLMLVEDLGDLHGMVFVFEEERRGGFWMKNTLIPLDIAFFDASGSFVGSLTMEPCEADPCPSYDIGRAYRFALEAPAGELSHLVDESFLEF